MIGASATALTRKELREHAWVVPVIALLSVLVWLTLEREDELGLRSMSALTVSARFILGWLLVPALVFGNRLIVREYHGQTQLFIETLPISRLQMAWVKYLLGLALLSALAAGALAAGLIKAARTETIDAAFALGLSARVAVSVYALWGVLFGMGFVGRWRFFVYGLCFVVVMLLENTSRFHLGTFGPARLLDPTSFGLERAPLLPGVPALESFVLGSAGLGLGLWLATFHEGSLAETLAKRLSHRDYSAMAIVTLAAVLLFAMAAERPAQRPFEFVEDTVLRSARGHLEVFYGHPRNLDAAQRLMDRTEPVLSALFGALAWEAPPPVRLAQDGTLEPHRYRYVPLSREDGLYYDVNFTSRNWNQARFAQHLVHGLLAYRTRGRVLFEPRHWFLDGFAYAFAIDHTPVALDAPLPEPEADTRQAEHAAWPPEPDMERALLSLAQRIERRAPLSLDGLHAWQRRTEELGTPAAGAVAFALVRHLAARHGQGVVNRLARTTLAEPVPKDVRAVLAERANPFDRQFERTAGASLSELVASYGAFIGGQDPDRDGQPWSRVQPRGRMTLIADEDGRAPTLSYRFDFDAALSALPKGTLCSLVYTDIGPLDQPLFEPGLQRRDHLCASIAGQDQRFIAPFAAGTRGFAALQVEDPSGAFFVRLQGERMDVPP